VIRLNVASNLLAFGCVLVLVELLLPGLVLGLLRSVPR